MSLWTHHCIISAVNGKRERKKTSFLLSSSCWALFIVFVNFPGKIECFHAQLQSGFAHNTMLKKLLEQKKSTNLNFYEVFRSHRFLKLIKNHIEPRHHHYSSRILKYCSQFLSEDVYPINFHLPIHSRQLPIAPLFSLRQNFSPISSWLLIKNLSLCIDDDEWEIVRQYAPFTIQKSYHIEHR